MDRVICNLNLLATEDKHLDCVCCNKTLAHVAAMPIGESFDLFVRVKDVQVRDGIAYKDSMVIAGDNPWCTVLLKSWVGRERLIHSYWDKIYVRGGEKKPGVYLVEPGVICIPGMAAVGLRHRAYWREG